MPLRRMDKSISPPKTFTFNVPFTETQLDGSTVLPTTEPATGQFIYTVQASDLQVVSPAVPGVIGKICPVAMLAGKMDTTAGTISYRILLNGTSLATGTTASVTASNYWTLNIVNSALSQQPSAPKVGDVIEIRLWCTQPNTTLLYTSMGFYASKLMLTSAPVVKDVYWLGTCSPVPAKGVSPVLSGDNWGVPLGRYYTTLRGSGVFNTYGTTLMTWFDSNNGDTYMPYYVVEKTYGFGGVSFGDTSFMTTVSLKTHATSYPYYERSPVPKTVSFREMW